MTIDYIKNKLEPVYQFLKERCYGFILVGSNILPWIRTKHDIDVIVVFKNRACRQELSSNPILKKEFKKIRDSLKNDKIVLLSRFENILINNEWNYQNKFFEVIKGEIPYDYSYDIFSKDYIELLKTNFDYIYNEYITNNLFKKNLYHILTSIYMIQNNSYELTSEQIENVNIIHDMSNEDKYIELLNWAHSWLYNKEED